MTEETIPQMRDTIDRLQKDLKGFTKENDELKVENRGLVSRELARDAKLDPKIGDLYARSTPDELTAEGFTAFATDFDFSPVDAGDPPGEGESAPAGGDESGSSAPGSADLAQMARGGSSTGAGAGSPSEETMTRAEWTELSRTDPVAARTALAKGRVQIRRDNPYAGGTQPVGNPFNLGRS